MNFGITPEERDLQRLAADVLRPFSARAEWSPANSAALVDEAWRQLASVDLLCAGIPERWGGVGSSVTDTTLIAQEIGRAGLPLPYVSAVPGAAVAIARFGREDLNAVVLPDVLAGRTMATAAIPGFDGGGVVSLLAGDVLRGEITHVAGGDRAERVLVPVRAADGTATFALVDVMSPGVQRRLVEVTDHTREAYFRFNDVRLPAEAILASADVVNPHTWLRAHTMAATCGMQLGLCAAALAMAAEHCDERRQFGRRLSDFQAVTQRMADAFVTLQTMQVATWRLVALLDSGRYADVAALVAASLSAQGAAEIMRCAVHVHGGTGVDVSYPLPRYVVMSKRYELWMGGAGSQLASLGDALAQLDDLDALMLG